MDTAPNGPVSFEDQALTVIRGAASFMARGLAREYQAFVTRDVGGTVQAMEAWSAAAQLSADRFRGLVAGPDFSPAAAASLQAMAREMTPSGDTDTASRHLAAAIMDAGRDDAIYRFAGAQYQAVYAEANGLLPDTAPTTTADTDPKLDNPIVLAAGGGMRCEGFSGGCQSGGSWGTTATHTVTGRNVCRSCAVKLLGIGSASGAEQARILSDYER